jgi:sulfite reductase alpha subunit-like flavoprotein
MSKVLIITGSETGQTEREMKTIVSEWTARKDRKFEIAKVISGNKISKEFDNLCDNYDLMVVATSSFGDGDAPSSFTLFLEKLYEKKLEAKNGGILDGMQHCVLGFGSTVYETFQNCPRLTDRLLEECGSRRFLERVEVDECDPTEACMKKVEAWKESTFKYLNKPAAASKPPACEWAIPDGAMVLEKNAEGEEGSQSGNFYLFLAVVMAVIAFAFREKLMPLLGME